MKSIRILAIISIILASINAFLSYPQGILFALIAIGLLNLETNMSKLDKK